MSIYTSLIGLPVEVLSNDVRFAIYALPLQPVLAGSLPLQPLPLQPSAETLGEKTVLSSANANTLLMSMFLTNVVFRIINTLRWWLIVSIIVSRP